MFKGEEFEAEAEAESAPATRALSRTSHGMADKSRTALPPTSTIDQSQTQTGKQTRNRNAIICRSLSLKLVPFALLHKTAI